MVKLGILEAGQNRPQFIETHGTMGDWFVPFLNQAKKEYSFKFFKAYQGHLPGSADECSAYLITGSAHSVYEKLDWLDKLGSFIRDSADQIPIVGICFGHQLLHHIYGGKVCASDLGWCIGVHEYEVFQQLEWMHPVVSQFNLLASHKDQVLEPAKGAHVLAGSPFCPVAASTIGKNILTIQPHPELDKGLAELIYKLRRNEQGADVTESALSTMDRKIDDGIVAKWITNFLYSRL